VVDSVGGHEVCGPLSCVGFGVIGLEMGNRAGR
jgi:hypothetical protein